MYVEEVDRPRTVQPLALATMRLAQGDTDKCCMGYRTMPFVIGLTEPRARTNFAR